MRLERRTYTSLSAIQQSFQGRMRLERRTYTSSSAIQSPVQVIVYIHQFIYM